MGEAIRLLATITPRNKGAIEFGSDIQWICTYGRPNGTPIPQWIAEVIQVKRLPDNPETRISIVFLTQVAEAQCDGWGQSKEVPAGGRLSGREVSALMAGETLSLLLNDQTLAPQRGQLLAKYLLETKAPEQLRLMGRMVRRIEGGIMIPKLAPNPVAHAYDREMQAVRMSETWEVAMERLACRESTPAGQISLIL